MDISKVYIVVTYSEYTGIKLEFFTDKDKAEAYAEEFKSIQRFLSFRYSVKEHEVPVYPDDTWDSILERGDKLLVQRCNRRQWEKWCLEQKHEGKTKENKVKRETGLSFGQAIEAIREGKRCSRIGWDNYQYIELATHIRYKDAHGDIVNTNGHYAIAFVDMCGAYLGWLPSQSDMLAYDWQVVNEKRD